MNRWNLYGAFYLMLLLGGCSTKPVPLQKPIVQTPLIHPLFFQEEVASQLNFPFWFNDSLVRAQHLQSVTRTVYPSLEIDPEQNSTAETFPKMTTVYTFSPEGKLIFVEHTDFSEGIPIAVQRYSITVPAAGNYSEVMVLKSRKRDSEEEHTESYTLLRKKRPRQHVFQYDDTYSDTRYHFFPDKRFWGALSIDSIGHPGTQDWIICGTPEKPEKRYQVRNTVTETNVTHYTYLNANYPEMITWSDYPFTQKRSFSYSKKGIFEGYIDSTFIDQSFVTRSVTSFSLDDYSRPVRITHQKDHAAGETSYQTIEKISYTFFTSK